MKYLKLLLIAGVLIQSGILFSQTIDTLEIDYNYNFVPTGQFSADLDTVYVVYFLIDTINLSSYKRLILIADENEKIFSVKPEDIATDSRFVMNGSKYTINIGEWTQTSSWLIKGKRYDDNETILKRKYDSQKVKHIVFRPENKWKLERDLDIPVPAEEIEN